MTTPYSPAVQPGRAWVAGLPAGLAGQRALLTGLLDFCAADARARWLVIGCSLARGAADALSDLDLAIGIDPGPDDPGASRAGDDAFAAACADVRRAVDRLGGPGHLVGSYTHRLPEVPGPHQRIFAQYADRAQIDLVVFPASTDPGSIPGVIVLHDPGGQVTARPQPRAVTAGQAAEWAWAGWCALADLGKYLRRGSAWEALGRLDEARAQLWKLRAAAGGVADARYGLTSILDFAPGTLGTDMAGTVAGLDPADLTLAARATARLLTAASEHLPEPLRGGQPGAMARFITADLDALNMEAPVRA